MIFTFQNHFISIGIGGCYFGCGCFGRHYHNAWWIVIFDVKVTSYAWFSAEAAIIPRLFISPLLLLALMWILLLPDPSNSLFFILYPLSFILCFLITLFILYGAPLILKVPAASKASFLRYRLLSVTLKKYLIFLYIIFNDQIKPSFLLP
jgi:hypothetical protein